MKRRRKNYSGEEKAAIPTVNEFPSAKGLTGTDGKDVAIMTIPTDRPEPVHLYTNQIKAKE